MEKQHKISKAQQKAVNRYIQKNYDRIQIFFSKGQKNKIKAHAQAQGESLNAFVFRAISETMERERNQNNNKKTNKKQNKNNTDISNPPNTTATEISKMEPNNAQLIPQDLQKLLKEKEELVDLDRLCSDMMYQFDIQNTFGVDGLARLLEKARNKNT